jgi:hypothetical protein
LQADTVEAAFIGLGLDDFDWYPLAPAALMPGQDEALRAIAAQWSRLLFEFDGAGDGPWRWRADFPARLDADLRQPTGLRWRRALRWSFADFLSTQPDPARHVVDLSTPAPLDAAPLLIVNDLPLSPLGVQELLVEVRSGGPSGMLSHAFRPGEAGAASLRYVRRSFDEQALSWRCRATIATSDGPVVQTSDFRPGSPLVEVSAQALGLKVLRLAAQAEVFDLVPTLEVTVGSRRHALSRTAPASWAIGRQPPPQALMTAVSSTGQRAELGAVPLSPTGLLVGVPQLGLQSMAAVRLDAPGSLSASLAYLAVEIEGLGWHSLEPGGAFEFSWPRASAFDPPAWRYRTRHVPRLADGRTQPWVDSGWHATTGTVAELVLS